MYNTHMNNAERTTQLRLGGDFGGDIPNPVVIIPEKKVETISEHLNAPEGSTHLIVLGKDVFFAIEPQVDLTGGSYENVYKVKKPFYAEHIKAEGKWEYFKIKGMTKDQLFGVFYRGERIGLSEGVVFRTKKANRVKI